MIEIEEGVRTGNPEAFSMERLRKRTRGEGDDLRNR